MNWTQWVSGCHRVVLISGLNFVPSHCLCPSIWAPKLPELRDPCWQVLRHCLGLLCQGRHAGFRPALRWAWQRQDSDSNIQLPTFKVSIPGGPADSNIPSWSGNGETCPWQKLLNQAEGPSCDHQRTEGKIVTVNRSPHHPYPRRGHRARQGPPGPCPIPVQRGGVTHCDGAHDRRQASKQPLGFSVPLVLGHSAGEVTQR